MFPPPRVVSDREPPPQRLARELLGSGGADLQDLVDLLRSSVGAELTTLTVHDGGRFHFLVCSGAEPFVVDEQDSVCRFSMGHDEVVEIPDLTADERTRDLAYVDGRAAAFRAYASAPVHAPDGTMVGRLCVFDLAPRTLTPAQATLLRVLADSASAHLDVRVRLRATVAAAIDPAADPATSSRIEHDLRSPLGSMRTSLDLLTEVTAGAEDATAQRLVGIAQRSAVRLTDLVEALARLHEMSTPPVPRVVHLGDLVARVFEELHDELEVVGGWAEASNLPVLTCDPGRVEMVLQELVRNAVTFRREEAPLRVQVTARRVGEVDWRVAVSDNGIGIPAADRTKVFDVLTRLTNRPGHGLGLPTVLRAVSGQGGRVGIEDGPGGVGTTVWFELPG